MKLHLKNYFNLKTLLLLSPVFLFIIIRYLIGFNGLYGQDSHEYYRYSRAIIDFFKTGNSPGDYFWPIYYPAFGAVLGLFIDNLFSLQLISFLSLSGCLYFLLKIIDNIYIEKNYSVIYLLITFLFAPYVFRNSIVVMSDLLTVFFITSSFFFFLGYINKNGANQFIFFTVFSLLAVLTRYAAAVVVIVPSIIIFYEIIRKKNFSHIIIGIVIATLLIIPHILIRKSNSTEFLGHEWLQKWSLLNFIKRDFVTPDGTEHFRFPNILNSFSTIFFPTYLIFGIVLVFFLQKKIFNNKLWLISLSVILIYALFLSGIPYQNQRFFLLSYPFVVIILYPAFERMMSYLQNKKGLKYLIIAFMLVVQLFFCLYFFKSAYDRNILEKEISGYVMNSGYQNVYAFDIDVSFSSYGVDKNVFNLWKEKYNDFKTGSVVIFNEDKFRNQWAGKNPMLNWIELKTNYNLIEMKDFGNGWKAYEIHPVR